ncbi:Bifunctional acetohydroxyacid reductoisomerase [Coemansia sp. RSA 376]|nr:Bifunctional acetohydroxyacid reductoisomerase [Coemansia sp. S3946]KAJ2044434.1 Bifunctional acetohydroxyacid reductoisomerase [Coemansia sp. S16]KAJ2068359.1 Bifunctional acetohydroxyacid reductoisomerase [Coemansia sp. S2]KAJ2262642.1 Bifunctional acetohydroxyacid reductoisomerase [Coemansia sp. RSA 376]KAJ2351319.1 Bifunctional acetohydroxyacid reductoisomerase [Coemansia sp. RSA 2673]
MASRAAARSFARSAASAARAPIASRVLAAAPRFAARAAAPAVFSSSLQQSRGIKTLNFGGSQEKVYERSDWPKEKLLDYFKNDTIAVLGYGPQGHGQGLNLRDNGLNVIVGVRKDGRSWKKAVAEGWVPGKNLFSIEEAANKGNIVFNLLSDAAQRDLWPTIKPYITPGKTLYFSHGFAITYKDQTHVEAPQGVDVVLCAPKGSGATLRTLFLEGKGLNSSIAVFQDVSGKAHERVVALGVAIGSGYLYETTFEKEVYSDLVGERGILMGAINGLFRAQYDVLRAQGHSPSEAFNETVEEATQSLIPLIGAKGMDWMYANCSVTAQRGALDWHQKFYDASLPVFKDLYESVKNGSETKRALDKNSQPDYRESLEIELAEIRESEIWRAGETVRSLRPENNKK